jgi:hypothetical protein
MSAPERVRERIRVQDHEWDEIRGRDRADRAKLMAERPRVVRFDSVPWEQSRSAQHKVYTSYDLPTVDRKPWTGS